MRLLNVESLVNNCALVNVPSCVMMTLTLSPTLSFNTVEAPTEDCVVAEVTDVAIDNTDA